MIDIKHEIVVAKNNITNDLVVKNPITSNPIKVI